MAISAIERARAYVDKIPGAVSGSGGHNQTYVVACALVHGFALGEADAFTLISEYNTRCQPPWSEKELRHKLVSAASSTHDKPIGHLLREGGNGGPPAYGVRAAPGSARASHTSSHTSSPAWEHGLEGTSVSSTSSAAPASSESAPERECFAKLDRQKWEPLPEPFDNAVACSKFIQSVFLPGEHVGIARAIVNPKDPTRLIPEPPAKTTHSREDLLTRLEKENGCPDYLQTREPATIHGLYVRVNPMKSGCGSDADVTSFRHLLVEFDEGTLEEQWNLIRQSHLPCAAVLYSGKRSLHAWVRVDASNADEYRSRQEEVYRFFSGRNELDPKNKNSSRFSRLPGAHRQGQEQRLYALAIGEASFSEWKVWRQNQSLGQHITIRELIQFDPENDPNQLLGRRRWLCRGGCCVWVGASGIGKSSIAMQAACFWALMMEFFGVPARKFIRSLFIQAENDLGDLADMVKGVVWGMKIPSNEVKDKIDHLQRNIIIVRNQVATGVEFAKVAGKLIDAHKPDLVWVDPLLAFFGEDISNQKECSSFLRHHLNPISEATGIVWMPLHHTTKPPADAKARSHWTATDYSYFGTGSAELTNWARAYVVLRQITDHGFKLMFTKRGERAGALDLQREATSDVWVKHSEEGIFWEQTDEEAVMGEVSQENLASNSMADNILQLLRAKDLTTSEWQKRTFVELGVSRTIFHRIKEKLNSEGKVWRGATEKWTAVLDRQGHELDS